MWSKDLVGLKWCQPWNECELIKYFLLQNELIIQIMTESHEIDNLKRNVEDAKMKLVTEIKVESNYDFIHDQGLK